MRKSKKMGTAIAFLKKHCGITEREAEIIYYIVKANINYNLKPADEILYDYRNGLIEFDKESSYYRRLKKI